jgi:predicted RNA-binding Zn-ribbon protein involved in translation (DUF1610 family)
MMKENSLEFKLCPSCGSTQYLENYPTQGTSICAECGHEITAIALKVIQEEDEETSYACPSCGKENETKEALIDGYEVLLKCKACSKLYGYRILPSTGWDSETLDNNDFDRKAVAIAKTEGKLIYSVKSTKKEKKSVVNSKQLERIADEKTETLKTMGIRLEIINLAIEKARIFITNEGPFTEKQLKSLFSASFILTQSNLLESGEIRGKNLTECQIAEIFDVDRKTTRKWKKILRTGTVKVHL